MHLTSQNHIEITHTILYSYHDLRCTTTLKRPLAKNPCMYIDVPKVPEPADISKKHIALKQKNSCSIFLKILFKYLSPPHSAPIGVFLNRNPHFSLQIQILCLKIRKFNMKHFFWFAIDGAAIIATQGKWCEHSSNLIPSHRTPKPIPNHTSVVGMGGNFNILNGKSHCLLLIRILKRLITRGLQINFFIRVNSGEICSHRDDLFT